MAEVAPRRWVRVLFWSVVSLEWGCAAAAPVILLVLFAATRAELYCPLYPAIDTVFAPGYSERHFDEIIPTMTKPEVTQRLGRPLRSFRVTSEWHPLLKPAAVEGWSYSHDGACGWGDFAWLGRYVYFDSQGRVTEVGRVVHHD